MNAHNLCFGASPRRRPDQKAKAPATMSETPPEIESVDSHSTKSGSVKLLISTPDWTYWEFLHHTSEASKSNPSDSLCPSFMYCKYYYLPSVTLVWLKSISLVGVKE